MHGYHNPREHDKQSGLSQVAFDQYYDTRYEQSTFPEEYAIEISVYQRDLESAYERLMRFLKDAHLESPLLHQNEVDLIGLCTAKPKILATAWAIPSIGSDSKIGGKDMIDKFEKDTEFYGYHLPPGYDGMLNWYRAVWLYLIVLYRFQNSSVCSLRHVYCDTILL